MTNISHPGYNGWAGVVAIVLLAEILDKRTMSDAFRTAPKPVTMAIWSVTTAHLFGLIPQKYDPFHWMSKIPVPRMPKDVLFAEI